MASGWGECSARKPGSSHIVEAASIAMPRRHRRAKTDRIDGETLIRALMAWKRGEPRACSMVKLLTPEEEDIRRLGPERKTPIAEHVFHVNRIKGLLFTQGIREYEPLRRNRSAWMSSNRRWPDAIEAPESRDLPRTRSPRIAADTNQSSRSRPRCVDVTRVHQHTDKSGRAFKDQGNWSRVRDDTLLRRLVQTPIGGQSRPTQGSLALAKRQR